MTVRTRFAPSPTGHLHVGGARTAILNWLLARHHGGSFVLRIEDTDRERNVPGAEAALLDDLRWLGVEWDEGPDVGGPHAPYLQSERFGIHMKYVPRLIERGRAYWCACPPSEAREISSGRRRCPCAQRGLQEIAPVGAALRFRVPDEGEVIVRDLVRGEIRYPVHDIEDFAILRSDHLPTYNFAAAVDDADMRITHVVRGADHLNNTPKQILIYEALGLPLPHFAHVPLILGPDRQKLSKRHGATSVAEHRRQGYHPEALFNYLSLLGWSSPSGEEVLPRERLVAEVDLDRVGRADAVFDREKLRWLSGRYLQEMPPEALAEALRPFVDRERFPLREEALPALAAAVRERISVLSEVEEQLPHFTGPATARAREARESALEDPGARRVLSAVRERLAALPAWEEPAIHDAVRAAGRDAGAKGKALFHPLRRALTGEEHGPDLARVAAVLGRARTLELLSFDERPSAP